MDVVSQKSQKATLLAGIISILLLLFLISFSSPLLLHLAGLSNINGTIFFVSRILNWMCLVFIWFYAIKIEKQSLLIWAERKYKFTTHLVSLLALYLIIFIGGFIIVQLLSFISPVSKSDKLSEIITILRANKFLLVFTCLTAGVVEELIFRGYMLPRLVTIFKSPALAIIISSILFGLLHYKYGTIINMVVPGFIGLVFGYYYWKYRNITVLIICHSLWDLGSLLVSLHAH